MSDSFYNRVARIVELLNLNGNTRRYQESIKLLAPEDLFVLRKLKAIHARSKHKANIVRYNKQENTINHEGTIGEYNNILADEIVPMDQILQTT